MLKNFILGISIICLRLNLSHALILNENHHFARGSYAIKLMRIVENRDNVFHDHDLIMRKGNDDGKEMAEQRATVMV